MEREHIQDVYQKEAAFHREPGGRRKSKESAACWFRAETSQDCAHIDMVEGEFPACITPRNQNQL